jgi:hypothetical protein
MRSSFNLSFAGAAVITLALAAMLSTSAPQAAEPAASPATLQPIANLRQLMIGMFYPESNVVFAAQGDLAAFRQAEDAATSPNPLTSIYPGWQAVQDAAVSLEDAANLLLLSGRSCSNGEPVPVRRRDWAQFVAVLRNGAQAAYKAANDRSQDEMVTASYTLTQACDACHAAYRDKYAKQDSKRVCLP